MIGLRIATLGAVALVLGTLGYGVAASRSPSETYSLERTLELLDAGTNVLFLVGGALFFLATFERRVRRARVRRALRELHSLAHVVDLHQLTKDPTRVLEPGAFWTSSSPKLALSSFELARYLDYCSELLAHIGKIGALYVQRFADDAAVAAANDLERLTTGLSGKIWQKIMILEVDEKRAGR